MTQIKTVLFCILIFICGCISPSNGIDEAVDKPLTEMIVIFLGTLSLSIIFYIGLDMLQYVKKNKLI